MDNTQSLTRVVGLFIAEGSLVEKVTATVIKRGIRGPGGAGYWLVQTEPTKFVEGRPPSTYLIIGPGGRGERLEWMDEGKSSIVGCHMMLDETGRAPNLESFDFRTAYDFGRGDVERLE